MKADKIQVTGFDYCSLDKDTAGKLQYYSTFGRALIRKNMIRFIAEFGQMLSEARELLAHHGDGTFCKWAATEFDLSRQTVYRYVNTWERCLSHGVTNYDNISPTALYLLSHDDTPKTVRTKALRLAGKKTTVTTADVKALLPATNLTGGGKGESVPPPTEKQGGAVGPIDVNSEPSDAPETPDDPPKRTGSGTPRKQYARSDWMKQWEQAIGPVVRLVDKIADGVGASGCHTQSLVQSHLNAATEEMTDWMRVGPQPSYGKCPACASAKWTEDDDGVSCAKCHHPHGEPAGDLDEDRLKTQRQKTVKTAEALLRAFDDLQTMKAKPEHEAVIADCKRLVKVAKEWK